MKKAITRFSKDGKTKVILHVRLSDPCRNGHNDFAFTADVYKKINGSNRFSKISAGAIFSKKDILLIGKLFPDVVKFLPLYLADEQGRPMYYVENPVYYFKTEGVKSGADYLNIDEETASKIWEKSRISTKRMRTSRKKLKRSMPNSACSTSGRNLLMNVYHTSLQRLTTKSNHWVRTCVHQPLLQLTIHK